MGLKVWDLGLRVWDFGLRVCAWVRVRGRGFEGGRRGAWPRVFCFKVGGLRVEANTIGGLND